MRPHRIIPVLLAFAVAACFGAGRAAAQARPRGRPRVAPASREEIVREGAWNTSLEAAQNVARYTGRPVLVLFAEDWCGYCEQLEKLIVHKELRDVARRFILVKLLPDHHAKLMADHGITGHHQVLMLDWSGKEAGKVIAYETARDVATKVIAAAVASDRLAGDKLLTLGYYRKAADRYNIIIKVARAEAPIAHARRQLEAIRERGKRRLELVKQLVRSNRLDEAAEACRQIIEDFPPDAGPAEARRILVKLRSGRPVHFEDVPERATVAAADAAKRWLERGMVHEWDKQYYDAVRTYRLLIERHPDVDAADEGEDVPVAVDQAQRVPAHGRGGRDRETERRLPTQLADLAVQHDESSVVAGNDHPATGDDRLRGDARRVPTLIGAEGQQRRTGLVAPEFGAVAETERTQHPVGRPAEDGPACHRRRRRQHLIPRRHLGQRLLPRDLARPALDHQQHLSRGCAARRPLGLSQCARRHAGEDDVFA